MNFKKFMIPAIALAMSIVGCNDNKPAGKTWDKNVRDEMTELLDYVLPYFKTPEDTTFEINSSYQFVIHFEDASYDAIVEFAKNVDKILLKNGFNGSFDETDAQGTYSREASSKEIYGETFDRSIIVTTRCVDWSYVPGWTSDFYLYAYNSYGYVDVTDFPEAFVQSAVGQEVEYIESSAYMLSYMDGDVAIVASIGKDLSDMATFAESLENQYYYVNFDDEEGSLFSLNWEETYAIDGMVDQIDDDAYATFVSYYKYEPADIYDAFPQDLVVDYYTEVAELDFETELPEGFSVPAIPASSVASSTGFKVWFDSSSELNIDVIDLNPSNPSLKLSVAYPAILVEAGFAYDEEANCYSKVIEEDVWQVDIYIYESDAGYFSVCYSSWYAL